MECNELIHNVKVFGLTDAVRRSKYADVADVVTATGTVTPATKFLGASPIGAGLDRFLSGIVVQFDLTLSKDAWAEIEHYEHLDIIGRQSTISAIQSFDLDSSYISYVDPRIVDIMHELQDDYNRLIVSDDPEDLPLAREAYLRLIYSNPVGCRLTAGISTNYLELKTIYLQHRHSKLPELRVFCSWIETLPQFDELILKSKLKNHRITREEIEGKE